MNAVDSALDPLVFDYISCGVSDIVNNLWTWLAVLTAAVSFWRIRRASIDEAPSTPSRSSILRLTLQVPTPGFVLHRTSRGGQHLNSESMPGAVTTPSTPKTPASSPIVCDDEDVVTKGKFVAYYREAVEESREEDVVEGGYGEGEDDNNGGVGKGFWGTELKVVRMRGELGWYKYQDFTAINGNVVRLWDGVRSGDGESCDGDGSLL